MARRMSLRCWAAITLPAATVVRLSACRRVFIWMARTVPRTAGAGLGQLRVVAGWTGVIAARSSGECLALIAVPAGNTSPGVASVKISANLSGTGRLSLIVSVHLVAVTLPA